MLPSISTNDIFPNPNLLSLWSISKIGHNPSIPLITTSSELVSFGFPLVHYKSRSCSIFFMRKISINDLFTYFF